VKGKVSYLEIAIDFLFKDTSDLLIFQSGVQSSWRYFPASGTAPSSYTGAKKSVSKSLAYTKIEPFGMGGDVWTCPRARFERRLRYLGVSPVELGNLPNKFSGLWVISIAAADSLVVHEVNHWAEFVQIAKAFGIASALTHFPKQRANLLKLLKQCRVEWWKPATYMKNWEETVSTQLRLHLACNQLHDVAHTSTPSKSASAVIGP
jgi:hypothetical protein